MAVHDLPDIPRGWFLHRAAHEHTSIAYRGDTHEPLPHAEGAYIVEFQHVNGGRLTIGRGRTLADAWAAAARAVVTGAL